MMDVEDSAFYIKVTNLLRNMCDTCSYDYGDFTVTLNQLDQLGRCITFLRDHDDCLFKQLIDITAVDYLEREKRFELVYHFLSLAYNKRLRLEVSVGENEKAPSITSVFKCANWYEREVFDLYGVIFEGHTDLRRILTDYNFDGYPLRKDFPLTGYYEVRFDNESQKVVYDPVSFPQSLRTFDYVSPWEMALEATVEGYTLPRDGSSAQGPFLLPGDEKALNRESGTEKGTV